MPLLGKKMLKYVKSFPKREGYSEELKSKYDRRLINYATAGLEQLKLLAEKLPEDMQAKIFSEQYLKSFFKALFNMDFFLQSKSTEGFVQVPKDISEKKGFVQVPKDISEKKERMLAICNLALDQIAHRLNAAVLAPRAWSIIKELGSSPHDAMYGTNAFQALRIDGYHSIKTVNGFLEHARGK